MELTIDGMLINDKDTLFEEIAKQFPVPDYFGNNLDALHDIFSEQAEQIRINIQASRQLKEALGGSYYYQLIDMLEDCCCEVSIDPE